MKKETSAGIIVFYQNNKKKIREYLLLKYLGGHWDFPKGHIEIYETPEQTAIRELKEETGLDVKLIKGFKKVINYHFRNKGEFIIKDVIYFLGRSYSQKVILSEEHKGYTWANYQEALNLITYNKKLLIEAEKFLRLKNRK
ncbi:MAG: diadenosine 5'5'''-P1,P4-tetraphosphate pyrophosphohydrolase [Candidatus Parcubacteria bacterium]|nr:MAG: diadenosine 5'5'''-P1,P4-tetraphosphate pyrophosphohydrolase [Candidatus Parcubacteria bacterium]